jgi:hypothetical protein
MGQSEADTLAMVPPPPEIVAPTSGSTLATVERQSAAKSAFDRTHVGKRAQRFFCDGRTGSRGCRSWEIGNGMKPREFKMRYNMKQRQPQFTVVSRYAGVLR